MADVTQLGYPAGFLGLDDNQTQSNSNANNLGNIRPTGSNTGFKQTPSKEQGLADIDANLLAYGQKHGIDTLRGVISRWAPASENDTGSYIDTVAKRLSLDPDQKIDLNDPAIRHLISTGIILQEKGPQSIYGAKSQSQQVVSDSPFALPQDTSEYKPYKAIVTKITAAQPKQQNANPLDVIGNKPTSPSIFNGLDTFGKNDVANAQKVINSISPEDWQKNSILANVGNVIYQTALGNEKEAKQAFNDLGDKGVGIIKGLYHAVEHAPETITNIVKNPITTGAQVAKGILYDPETLLTSGTPKGVLTEVSEAKPALVPISPKTDVPTYLRQKFSEKQGIAEPAAQTVTEPAKATVDIPVPQEKPPRPTTPVSDAKAAETEKLLRDVGVEKVRLSALNEDPLEATSQYLTSQADKGIYGTGMKEQIAHEKNALENHFGNIEKEIGGEIPTDVVGEIERGQKIKRALDEAQTAHELETKRLYNKATEELGDNQVQLNNFENYINKKSNFVHGPEQNLRTGVKSYLDEQGLIDKEGKISPMSVKQSEDLRQFINSQYNHETGNKVGNLVKTIDGDVFSNVGTKTYEEARAHFRSGKQTYDEPKAIKDLLSNEGVNQKIADEKVMTKIATLDESQFRHLMDTLKQNGKQDAIKEIQTNLVNRIKESGKSADLEPWNSIAAAKERQARSAKLQKAFEDNSEMLERINKGVLAGNKLYIPTRYKGAGIQTHLLHTKFGDFIGKGLTYAGWKSGLHGGALIGDVTGRALNTYLSKGKQTKQLQKEIKDIQSTKLSNIGKE